MQKDAALMEGEETGEALEEAKCRNPDAIWQGFGGAMLCCTVLSCPLGAGDLMQFGRDLAALC
jgi:hypothetical protein